MQLMLKKNALLNKILTLIFVFSFLSHSIDAQSSSMGGNSTMGSGSSKMETMKPLERPTPGIQPKPAPLPQIPAPASPIVQYAGYFYPGILVNRNGNWEGGDDLLNLTNNIGFYLTIIKPENDSLAIPEDKIKQTAETILKNAGIAPKTLTKPGQAPLPYFQVQILLYPIGKEGYVACCEGRLFESVSLQRITLDAKDMAYQAITWQKSSLIISPNSKINEQIQQHVEDIAKAFAERVQTFNDLKKELMK